MEPELTQIDHSEQVRVWGTALIAAALLTIPALLLKDKFPPAVIVAIGIGSVAVLVIEYLYHLIRSERHATRQKIIKLARDYAGLRELSKEYGFEIRTQPRDSKGQFYLFETSQGSEPSQRKLRRIETRSGQHLYVIGPDRFVELLVNELLYESDKVTELALARAWQRFGEAAGQYSDVRYFMDKVVLEAIKAEFRSNWLTLVARFGEQVIVDLRKQIEESTIEMPSSGKQKIEATGAR
jgi:hypothetical protein